MGRVDFESLKWFDPNLGVPAVSIGEYGLNFNRAATQELQGTKKIRLAFDRNNKLLVIKPIDSTDEEGAQRGLPFTPNKHGYVRVACKDYIRYISRDVDALDLSRTVKFFARWDDSHELVIVDLNFPVGGEVDPDE